MKPPQLRQSTHNISTANNTIKTIFQSITMSLLLVTSTPTIASWSSLESTIKKYSTTLAIGNTDKLEEINLHEKNITHKQIIGKMQKYIVDILSNVTISREKKESLASAIMAAYEGKQQTITIQETHKVWTSDIEISVPKNIQYMWTSLNIYASFELLYDAIKEKNLESFNEPLLIVIDEQWKKRPIGIETLWLYLESNATIKEHNSFENLHVRFAHQAFLEWNLPSASPFTFDNVVQDNIWWVYADRTWIYKDMQWNSYYKANDIYIPINKIDVSNNILSQAFVYVTWNQELLLTDKPVTFGMQRKKL